MNNVVNVLKTNPKALLVGGLVLGGVAIGVGTFLLVKHMKKKAAEKSNTVEAKEDEYTVEEMED